VDDSKAFDGKLLTYSQFNEWREDITRKNFNLNDEIVLAKPREILAEFRLFVVDGKYVTGSIYRKNNKPYFSPIVPNDVIHYSGELLQSWKPAKGFTLDVALTSSGYRVIEINCLNSSDFYASDMTKVVIAIETSGF